MDVAEKKRLELKRGCVSRPWVRPAPTCMEPLPSTVYQVLFNPANRWDQDQHWPLAVFNHVLAWCVNVSVLAWSFDWDTFLSLASFSTWQRWCARQALLAYWPKMQHVVPDKMQRGSQSAANWLWKKKLLSWKMWTKKIGGAEKWPHCCGWFHATWTERSDMLSFTGGSFLLVIVEHGKICVVRIRTMRKEF